MRYYVNPYSQIIATHGRYEFYAPPVKSSTVKTELTLECDALDRLISPEGMNKEEIVALAGEEKTEFMINNKILLSSVPCDCTVSSRTEQFYIQFLSEEQKQMINDANVLILGCGGIGSSIAWTLAGLGIKRMTIVDFDTIEASNLNRMFMFDKSDIGKKKIVVIKDKLQDLYPDLDITPVNRRISSEAELNEICSSDSYTLVIKALDSPVAFPVWLDSVCKSLSLPYVGGITLRDRVMVGPTFIPKVAEDGWSDIIKLDDSSERIFGKVPSIGNMLFNTTDRVATEAVKVLLGNYDACEYKHCIYSENIFTGEQESIRSKSSCFRDNGTRSCTALLNVLSTVGLGCLSLQNTLMLPFLFLMSVILPFFSYYGRRYVLLQTFINTAVSSVFLTLCVLKNISFNALSFCLVSIVITSIASMAALFLNSFIIKLTEKR